MKRIREAKDLISKAHARLELVRFDDEITYKAIRQVLMHLHSAYDGLDALERRMTTPPTPTPPREHP